MSSHVLGAATHHWPPGCIYQPRHGTRAVDSPSAHHSSLSTKDTLSLARSGTANQFTSSEAPNGLKSSGGMHAWVATETYNTVFLVSCTSYQNRTLPTLR